MSKNFQKAEIFLVSIHRNKQHPERDPSLKSAKKIMSGS
jgi:hypothetical protein